MKSLRKNFRYDNIGLLFVIPALIYMIVFIGYPIVQNVILSMQDVTVKNLVMGEKSFIWFDN